MELVGLCLNSAVKDGVLFLNTIKRRNLGLVVMKLGFEFEVFGLSTAKRVLLIGANSSEVSTISSCCTKLLVDIPHSLRKQLTLFIKILNSILQFMISHFKSRLQHIGLVLLAL